MKPSVFVCRLEEIGASASKEYSLEKSLEKMTREWAELHFGFAPYKDTVNTLNMKHKNITQLLLLKLIDLLKYNQFTPVHLYMHVCM